MAYKIELQIALLVLVIFSATKLYGMGDPAPVAETGPHLTESCRTLGVDEPCAWYHTYSPAQCTSQKPCDKLLIFFSGGDMSCNQLGATPSHPIHKILNTYIEKGYLAVCASTFTSNSAAAQMTYASEAVRIKALLKDIRDSDIVRTKWSGKHLLTSGVSHGATAPIIAMKHLDLPGFKSNGHSAMCMYDGVYNPQALDRFLWSGRSDYMCRAMRSRLICERYFGRKLCWYPAPADTLSPDVVRPADINKFTVHKFKLIECGSRLKNRCGVIGDALPQTTIHSLCQQINDEPNMSCAWDPMPWSSHLLCSTTPVGINKCLNWFEKTLAR